MNIAEKLTLIAENEQKVHNAGYAQGSKDGYEQGYTGGVAAGKDIGKEEAETKILEDCNAVAYLQPAESVEELPRLMTDAYEVGYVNGDRDGYNIGYDVGYDNGEIIGIEQGKQSQYNEFWDAFQQKGNRTEYNYAFHTSQWNDETYNPRYALTPVNAFQMFYSCAATDLKVALDTSNCIACSYMFCSSKFRTLPVIDLRKNHKTVIVQSMFYGASNLESIETVYLHGGDVGDSFERMTSLREIRLEGELVSSVNLSYSSKLSYYSIKSFVAALSDTVTGKTLTFSPTAVNNAFADEAWETLVATKPNWTIVK